ncbi:MAG: hypothetical protein JNK14_05790 [Chitinophagaceae bacterium]|nr:hypothetical protein [Chitinophagaceae bacterium]
MQANQLQKNQPNQPRPAKNSSLVYGNMDKEKKFAFNPLFTDHYLVRHFRMERLASGAMVEDPKSSSFQFYDEETFNDLSAQPVKNGKQGASKFEQQGLQTEVLHDPTLIN